MGLGSSVVLKRGASAADQRCAKVQGGKQEFDTRPLALKAICVILEKYQQLPSRLWDLCHEVSSPLEKRALRTEDFKDSIPEDVLERMLTIKRFRIIGIRTHHGFDRSLPSIPATVRRLCFAYPYNQPFVMPPQLEDLELSCTYSHCVELPPTIRRVEFGSSYTHPIHLPEGLQEAKLYLSASYAHYPVVLPTSLRKLSCYRYIGPLSENLEELVWCGSGEEFPYIDELPANLRSLDLAESSFDGPLDDIPTGLKELYLPESFSYPLKLPEGLEKLGLNMNEDYSDHIVEDLQKGLRELYVGNNLDVLFPPNLEKAVLGYNFNRQLWMPKSMKEIYIGNDDYNHAIYLPPGCRFRCWGPTFVGSEGKGSSIRRRWTKDKD